MVMRVKVAVFLSENLDITTTEQVTEQVKTCFSAWRINRYV
jgi:hypothetical protein